MLKLLENLDQFGVAFQPTLRYSKTQHRTVLGGIMSILLYGLSLAYLCYVFFLWKSGLTLPKITITQKINQNQVLELKETYVQFESRKFEFTYIDPFNPQAIILQPAIYYLKNGVLIEPPIPIFISQELNSKFYTINISNFLLSISESKSELDPEIEMMLTLGRCQEHLLQGDQKCANDNIVSDYFMQPTNVIILRQFMKEFNTATETVDIIGREQMISIQSNFTFQVQTYIRIQETNVDTGALFENINKYRFITDYRGSNSMLGLDYFYNIFRYDLFVSLYYKLDNIQSEQTITYPKLSEVLAEAGSIASTIFLLSYLVVMINQKQLQFEAVNNVIGMYYPDFNQIKITKNIFGQIRKVQKNDRLLDLNTFKKQYQKLVKIGETKLSISNQIYEISRIQFILQSIFTSTYMNQFHLHGIPFQLIGYDTQKEDQGSTVKLEMSLNQETNSIKQSSIVPVSINEKNQDTLLSTQQNFNMRPSKSSNLMIISSKDNLDGQKIDYKEYKDFDFQLLIIQNEKDDRENKEDNNTQQNQ
ncbi:unnamed protein product [Paramecium pentaurelia]|uniref:Transmembrane protein n=1 Tax=Paramecium pentaurelia TaxID=43138 RepID=A0A8S1XRK7_9CILI|nr:unnamed protein product [Paramecium pentaurelia]